MTQGMRMDVGFGPKGAVPRSDEGPMRLLLLGDFSGRPAAERAPLATRPWHRVDLDRFDGLFAKLAPRLATPLGEVRFEALDDFHPDALFARLALFGALREARTRPPPAALSTASSADAASPLSALLGGTPAAAARSGAGAAAAPDAIEDLIRRTIAPHVVPDRLADTRHYLAAVDSAIAQQMRELLHDPAFQSLECAWRGLHWLVSSLELDTPEQLELQLLDVTREELLADLAVAGGTVQNSALHAARVLRAGPPAQRCAIGALWPFGAGDTDIGLLAALAICAAQAGGVFLAAADAPALQASPSAWTALRTSEVAAHIGLFAPRVLLRRPYGARDDRTESFAFEEILGNTPALDARQYLWGSGALAGLLLLGRAWRAADGEAAAFAPDAHRQLDDLPAATRLDRDGEQELLPCAERFLSDAEAETWLAAGLMPLLSHRHRNAVQLMRWQSIAHPAAQLAGLVA